MPFINISPVNSGCDELTHDLLSKSQGRMEKHQDKKLANTQKPELFPVCATVAGCERGQWTTHVLLFKP